MEVEYQISYPEDVSSSLTSVTLSLLFFHWVNLRKFPETSGKSMENSEDGGKLRKCTCIYPAHKKETFSAPWTVWSCGTRLYVRKITSGVLSVRGGFFHNFDFETDLPLTKTIAGRNFPVLLRFVLSPTHYCVFCSGSTSIQSRSILRC